MGESLVSWGWFFKTDGIATYKLIRGIDFYKYCFDLIGHQKNITIQFGEVQSLTSTNKETSIVINGQKIYATYIFNSILFDKPVLKEKAYWLLQHFKGWIIETENPVFDPSQATLMDFRPDQKYGTAFVYCMPFTKTKALIEHTLFTKELLQAEQYDQELKNYIDQFLKISSYQIEEKEFGVIPMTNHRFPSRHHNIINIGTAGGQTKASSGYTFRFIQKHSAEIVKQLISTGKPFVPIVDKRFHFYDSTLLHILFHDTLPGRKIFTDLFKKNKPQHVLRFLDNESSVMDELKIISSLPTWPFLKAALRQL
jgi:lycopene beta-cyclase